MKIFLTGGTGLVGAAITAAFSRQPFQVKSISRNFQQNAGNITWIKADIANHTDNNLAAELKNVKVVVHNAACLFDGKTEQERSEIQKINVDFTRRLLDWSVANDIEKVIFTSSFSLLQKPLPDLISESSIVNPQTSYSISKFQGEQLVQEYAEKYGFKFAILRLSSPVSFDLNVMPSTVVKKWINQSICGQDIQLFGNGARTQDFVAVADIAQAFVECVNSTQASGIFNIASGSQLPMLELAKMITKKFGNSYSLTGEDENENDRWNIDIIKARQRLNYHPRYNSEQAIAALLNNIQL